jgi:hypothetical protein
MSTKKKDWRRESFDLKSQWDLKKNLNSEF